MPTLTLRALSLLTVIFCGCATSLQGGAQSTTQTGGPVSQEATFAAAAGLGDGSGALLIAARGSFGVDARTGRRIGSITAGYEWVAYGKDFSTVKTGYHFGLYGGPRMAAHEQEPWALVTAEAGYSWIVDRSPPSETSNGYGVTALTLTPMFGAALNVKDDGPPSGLLFGLRFGVRADSFTEWRFHL